MKAYHKLLIYSYSGVLNIGSRLVTLIVHAQKGYGTCLVSLIVCLSVCLSVYYHSSGGGIYFYDQTTV